MKHVSIFIFLLVVLAFASAGLAAFAPSPCRSAVGGYCLSVSMAAVTQGVPGLEFLGDTGGTGGLIAKLYTFGIGLVGVSALIMLILGGVIYTTAGDSQSRVNQARSMIGNAIFGLILALVSYLILYTINPDIVTRGFPNPKALSSSPTVGGAAGGTQGTITGWKCPASPYGITFAAGNQSGCNSNCSTACVPTH